MDLAAKGQSRPRHLRRILAPAGGASTVRARAREYVGLKSKVHSIVAETVPSVPTARVAGSEIDDAKFPSPT
jgi:hypothetical protein